MTTSDNHLNSGLLSKSYFWKCKEILTDHCISSVCSDRKIFCMTDTLSVNCCSDNIFDKHIHCFDNFRQPNSTLDYSSKLISENAKKVLTDHCISSICSGSKIFCMTDTLSVKCYSDNISDKHIDRFDNFRQPFKLWITF